MSLVSSNPGTYFYNWLVDRKAQLKLAIIIGISDYLHLSQLSACKNDANLVKHVFDRLQKFDDICFLNDSPKGKDAKQRVTEFVNTYKGKRIEELVFYYSGHGGRYDDDFFYVFSDFKEDKREVTGLRNTELDGLLRNLEPELTVKIVDACYSGSTYIKSDTDIGPLLEKSAKDNNLKKVYFLHSSSENETSLATKNFSFFTYSFLEALTQGPGEIRYRDIMAFVADSMMAQSLPRPVFVVQADNTEIFGKVEIDLIDFTKSELLIKDVLTDAITVQDTSVQVEDELLHLVLAKSGNEFCTQEEAESNLQTIRRLLDYKTWPDKITSFFTIDVEETDNTGNISNVAAIGNWLSKNASDNFFATPLIESKKYEVEEYKELPKKPSATHAMFAALSLYGEDNKDYKLEKVIKTKAVISGFRYSVDAPFKAARIYFKPKHTAVETYTLAVVLIFSRKTAVIFYSIEQLSLTAWETLQKPQSKEWKSKTAPLKSIEEINSSIAAIISDASDFILNDIKARLSK